MLKWKEEQERKKKKNKGKNKDEKKEKDCKKCVDGQYTGGRYGGGNQHNSGNQHGSGNQNGGGRGNESNRGGRGGGFAGYMGGRGRGNGGASQIQCYNCGQFGHKKFQCRNPHNPNFRPQQRQPSAPSQPAYPIIPGTTMLPANSMLPLPYYPTVTPPSTPAGRGTPASSGSPPSSGTPSGGGASSHGHFFMGAAQPQSQLVCQVCEQQGIPLHLLDHDVNDCPMLERMRRQPTQSRPSFGHFFISPVSDTEFLPLEKVEEPLWSGMAASELEGLYFLANHASIADLEVLQYTVGMCDAQTIREAAGEDSKMEKPLPVCFAARVLEPEEIAEAEAMKNEESVLSKEGSSSSSSSAVDSSSVDSPTPTKAGTFISRSSWSRIPYTQQAKVGSKHVPFPLSMGRCNVLNTYDTGTPYNFACPALWKAMDGDVVDYEVVFHGVSRRRTTRRWAKKVVYEANNRKVVALCYELDCGVDALLDHETALALGVKVENIPLHFPGSIPPRTDDLAWVRERKVFAETQWEEADVRLVYEATKEAMEANSKLPDSTFCNIAGTEFEIKLKKDAVPVFTRQYPIAVAVIPSVCERVSTWLNNCWVEESRGRVPEWHSPLLAAKKISGGVEDIYDIRLCMDFRRVNGVTEEPMYRIPLARHLVAKLCKKKYFTELDLANAYHQILLAAGSWHITYFTNPGGDFTFWKRLFFGPKGAVTHFQMVMELVVSDCSPHITVIVYVDNIIIASNSVKQHCRDVVEIIHLLTNAGLKLKPKKCKLCYKTIQFMGSIVDGERRCVDFKKVTAFKEMKRPETGKEVQSLLGFTNFLRNYIPSYSCVFGPIEKLRNMKKISVEEWESSGAKDAFEAAKEILSSSPVLHNPDFDLEFFVETDASQYGVGAVLYQEREGQPCYIDFAARAFSSSQQNYSAMKRELLGGMFAMETWRPLLLFRKFTWGLDNKALSYINEFNAARAGFHPMSTIVAGRPWDHIIWDLIGKLPTSVNGYNYVLIIVDVLTRFVVLKPLRTKSAEEIASRLVECFANFGVPKILQCDNDTALPWSV